MPPTPAARARTVPLRAALDPACAGCRQLVLVRALTRAGLETAGDLGCAAARAPERAPRGARWAAVLGASAVLEHGPAPVAAALRAGARAVIVSGERPADWAALASTLRAPGLAPALLDLDDLGATAAAVAGAERTVLVSLARCVRDDASGPPLRIDARRCNRCGACLGLGCPAVRDAGDAAMVVDPARCRGCALCAALCRPGALHRP